MRVFPPPYLTYPGLAAKTIVFCQAEHKDGYVAVALLREHQAKTGRVHYYAQHEAEPAILLQEIEPLIKYLAAEKWLRQPGGA